MVESAKIRTQKEAKVAVRSSLKTIRALCNLYDDGSYDTARDIATIIYRMIVDELNQTHLRRELPFLSYCIPPNPRNLLMQVLASSFDMRIQSDGSDLTIMVTHKPLFDELAQATGQPTTMKFNEWWNGPVLIAGAAEGSIIPLNESSQVPYKKREQTSRFDVIRMFRNKTGAHFDRQVDSDTQKIEDRLIRVTDFRIKQPNGKIISYAENPEVYTFINSRAGATVRHIAFEIDVSSNEWSL